MSEAGRACGKDWPGCIIWGMDCWRAILRTGGRLEGGGVMASCVTERRFEGGSVVD